MTNGVIHAGNAALYQHPEALDPVGVHVTTHPNFRGMVNALMLVAASTETRKLSTLVCVDQGARHDMFPNEPSVGLGTNCIHMTGLDSSLALYGTKHRSFVGDVAATLPTAASADVGVIDFDCSAERPMILVEQQTNSVEHAPRGLVGDASFTLNLLGRDTAAGLRHKVNSVEPQAKRSARVLEDRACHRVLMMTAAVAGIGWAALDPVVLGHFAADLAEDAIGVQVIPEPIKAGFVGWEVSFKVPDGVLFHGRYLPFGDSVP